MLHRLFGRKPAAEQKQSQPPKLLPSKIQGRSFKNVSDSSKDQDVQAFIQESGKIIDLFHKKENAEEKMKATAEVRDAARTKVVQCEQQLLLLDGSIKASEESRKVLQNKMSENQAGIAACQLKVAASQVKIAEYQAKIEEDQVSIDADQEEINRLTALLALEEAREQAEAKVQGGG